MAAAASRPGVFQFLPALVRGKKEGGPSAQDLVTAGPLAFIEGAAPLHYQEAIVLATNLIQQLLKVSRLKEHPRRGRSSLSLAVVYPDERGEGVLVYALQNGGRVRVFDSREKSSVDFGTGAGGQRADFPWRVFGDSPTAEEGVRALPVIGLHALPRGARIFVLGPEAGKKKVHAEQEKWILKRMYHDEGHHVFERDPELGVALQVLEEEELPLGMTMVLHEENAGHEVSQFVFHAMRLLLPELVKVLVTPVSAEERLSRVVAAEIALSLFPASLILQEASITILMNRGPVEDLELDSLKEAIEAWSLKIWRLEERRELLAMKAQFEAEKAFFIRSSIGMPAAHKALAQVEKDFNRQEAEILKDPLESRPLPVVLGEMPHTPVGVVAAARAAIEAPSAWRVVAGGGGGSGGAAAADTGRGRRLSLPSLDKI